jgi:hypothetical protein
VGEDKLASAKEHQIDLTFPPGTRHARMEEALEDGELGATRLQPPTSTLSGARFVTITYSTVSGRAERTGAILRHAWGVTLDTERQIAYVFDSKYERDAHAVVEHLASELLAEGRLRDVRWYVVHDLTMPDGQVEGTCTRWTVALNALIVAGVIDETVSKQEVFSRLSDDIVGDALEAVGFDVSVERSYEALTATLAAALSPK